MSEPVFPRRRALTVRGTVQGVGFRPFVYRLAHAHQLSGWVSNDADAVRIEVQGDLAALEAFVAGIRSQLPPAAHIEHLQVDEIAPAIGDTAAATFAIRPSEAGVMRRPIVPADLATCGECQAEFREPTERRHRYPFTNCTNCGPRWSIVTGLPYDRPRTSMESFVLCDACSREYANPLDRRFHAQPIACPECGPRLQALSPTGQLLAERQSALDVAAAAVREGKILALKGLGGFQLVVDATSEEAVQRLRLRKHRPDKPLAVLARETGEVMTFCVVTADERAALESSSAPILLLDRLSDECGTTIAPSVAPGNPQLGVMLPCTPLHHLLLEQVGRPVVCTSGNRSEEPMATRTAEALERLADIADVFLTHNRRIVRPVDDSVARMDGATLQLMRRARGFAPQPVMLDQTMPTVLAVGGHLKNTVALSIGNEAVLSPHVGDLDNVLSVNVHRRTIHDLVDFFAAVPEAVACDLHPDYASTRHAELLAAAWHVPLIRIQHHVAHVLSAIAECGLTGPVLGLSWDGTGFGLDGTVWGGEAIVVDGPQHLRVGHLRAFPLFGGDRTAREPRRAALGMLHVMGADSCRDWGRRWFTAAELDLFAAAMERGHAFPVSSSMGRLFDAVAALCGCRDRVSFEGEAAMQLEFAVDPAECSAYPCPVLAGWPAVADWVPLLDAVLADLADGVRRNTIAARFHNALANLALAWSQRVGCAQVVLTGGCFQNRVLRSRVRKRLSEAGFAVYTQHRVPCGDGGVALGQLLGAALQLGS
jgi:hydrogenase maturation protein HypF